MFISESLSTPTIAFKVRQVADTSPSSGDHVIYTVPVVNVGGGYDPSTGEFTVPRDGLYMFTIQMCTVSGKMLYLQIMAADQIIEATTYSEDSSSYTCTSGSGMAVVSTGDKVWVNCRSASSSGTVLSQSSDNSWNTFSGILINWANELSNLHSSLIYIRILFTLIHMYSMLLNI